MTRDAVFPCAPPSRRPALKVVVAAFPAPVSPAPSSSTLSAAIDRQADRALESLFASSDNAEALASRARGLLVFARVTNAGAALGGQEGDGVMRIGGASAAYYRIVGAPSASMNGANAFSLAFFFVAPSALVQMDRAGAWRNDENASPAAARSSYDPILNTSTLAEDVYAVPFGQRGLMASLGLEGSRIFRIHPTA